MPHQPGVVSPDGFLFDGYQNFWGDIRFTLRNNCEMQDNEARETRQILYAHIRHVTGLPFADYGDEPRKWLAWLKEADDSGLSEEHRARATAAATEGLPQWAVL